MSIILSNATFITTNKYLCIIFFILGSHKNICSILNIFKCFINRNQEKENLRKIGKKKGGGEERKPPEYYNEKITNLYRDSLLCKTLY